MSQFIDRRLNGKHKSAVNRQRFIERFKHQIKKSVNQAIAKRSITDIQAGEQISIPAKDTHEPTFRHDKGGLHQTTHPGNKEFIEGDKIKRPESGGAGGPGSGKASNQGEGLDDFVFQLTRDEFLDLFFDDLALPEMVKKQITKLEEHAPVRAGFTPTGVQTNLDIIRSMKSALSRRIALQGPLRKEKKDLLKELEKLQKQVKSSPDIISLQQQIKQIEKRIKTIPFIDTFDLRYHNIIKHPKPSTQAVMFCLMDVSGSMDEAKKDIAKRFFILLYLFLTRNYKTIELVFIRHHTSAKEVDEEEFFYSRETGGTVVSSALEMMKEIIHDRYPTSDWNIYGAQASDGDNWNADSPYCQELLQEHIMPLVQYFAYIEIMPRHHQSLWEAYQSLLDGNSNFNMQSLQSATEIYPVFRELFSRAKNE